MNNKGNLREETGFDPKAIRKYINPDTLPKKSHEKDEQVN